MRPNRLMAAVAVACLGSFDAPVHAAAPTPTPPCAGEAFPIPSPPGALPVVEVWHAPSLPDNWQPASCSGIAARSGTVYVAVAGEFQQAGDAGLLLGRVGALSHQVGLKYWNVDQGGWRPLLVDATALTANDPSARRPDFKAEELSPGARLYMLYADDSGSGPVVYQTEVRSAGPDGFVVVLHNSTAMRLMGMSIADPGDLSSMLSVQRIGPDRFAYYALTAVALAPLAAAMVSDASHINRAVASFRYLAGIPADSEPPAATQ
jgi:hypothetical protein